MLILPPLIAPWSAVKVMITFVWTSVESEMLNENINLSLDGVGDAIKIFSESFSGYRLVKTLLLEASGFELLKIEFLTGMLKSQVGIKILPHLLK